MNDDDCDEDNGDDDDGEGKVDDMRQRALYTARTLAVLATCVRASHTIHAAS